jgi:hypothetical protein
MNENKTLSFLIFIFFLKKKKKNKKITVTFSKKKEKCLSVAPVAIRWVWRPSRKNRTCAESGGESNASIPGSIGRRVRHAEPAGRRAHFRCSGRTRDRTGIVLLPKILAVVDYPIFNLKITGSKVRQPRIKGLSKKNEVLA